MTSSECGASDQDIPLIVKLPTSSSVHPRSSQQEPFHRKSSSLQRGSPRGPHVSPLTKILAAGYTELPTHELAGEQNHDSGAKAICHDSHVSGAWLPRPLRMPALLALLSFSIGLLLVVIFLHWTSVTRSGLGKDDGSTAIYFAWRFAPTLFAVIYAFSFMIILDEVTRTETFARLARRGGATASASILRTPKPWWSTFWDSFPSRKNKQFNLAMFCASTTYILGILLVSPFSSALLTSENVTILTDTTFQQFDLVRPLQLDMDALVYFQTIGHTLQNVTTSAWLSDDYAVLPFWPTDLVNPPLGATLATSAQTWKAVTSVFQSELVCEPLTSQNDALVNHTYTTVNAYNTSVNHFEILYSVKLESPSGCQLGLAFLTPFGDDGYSYWSDVSSTTNPLSRVAVERYFPQNNSTLFNLTADCSPGEVIIGLSNSSQTRMNTGGVLCTHEYFMSDLMVTASIDSGTASLSFDKDSFQRNRIAISDTLINTTNFDTQFLNDTWSAYIIDLGGGRPEMGGPANLLMALHNFITVDKIESTGLGRDATKIKQRAFGEALISSLGSQTTDATIQGHVTTVQRRIVVVQAIAIVLEAVLLLQAALLIGVAVSTRLRNRPLGVVRDPALTNTIVSLLSSHESIRKSFKGWHLGEVDVMNAEVKSKMYAISNNTLLSDPPEGEQSDPQPRKLLLAGNLVSSRPSGVLSTWMLYGLTFLLSAVLTTLAVLYWYSQHDSLSQIAFVYEAQVTVAGTTYGKLAPYSIIPTLLAVAIGLWWASMDSVFRQAQPFIDQARAPTASRNGSGMSYQSSYLLWAAFRALLRRHWLLALVSTGAFLAQILTIAMSALWTRQPWQQTAIDEAFQPLQLRQLPLVHQAYVSRRTRNGAFYVNDVMANVFDNLQTNWMYSAAIQLTLNGSEPPWSSEGWSFVPVDLVSALEVRDTQQLGSDGDLTSVVNATIGTPAIRARLECTSWNELQPVQWLTEYDLTNATQWDTSVNPNSFEKAFALGCDDDGRPRFINFQPNTSSSANACEYSGGIAEFRAGGETITCCTSGSGDDPEPASVGIWSPSYHQGQYFGGWPFLTWPTNITVKWITGRAFIAYRRASTFEMVWPEAPRLAALDCKPIVEMANATVKVNAATGAVQSYHILDEPQVDESAWASAFNQYVHGNATIDRSSELDVNFTTSYGVMFLEALLGSSSMQSFAGCGLDDCGAENLEDRNFNIRLPGLNVDYMTYSMLSLVQNDTTVMLDPATLTELAQRTFSTFFQHFASMDVALDGDGGWVYQKANATLPADLGEPTSVAIDSTVPKAMVNGSGAHSVLSQSTNATTTISTERPIEILRMSPLAVGLCLGILIWLVVTCLLVLILKKRYFSPLLRKVESVADIAVLVAGSERLLRFAEEKGPIALQADKTFKTRLGWFRTSAGEVRWGIELVEPGVQFLTEAEAHRLLSAKQSMPARLSKVQDSDQHASHVDSDA